MDAVFEFVLSLVFGALLAYFVVYFAVLNAIREAKSPSKVVKGLRSKEPNDA